VNSLIDPLLRRTEGCPPGPVHTFLKRVSSDSAVPPLTPGPLFIQVPGSCGIITTGHRGHGDIVPNGRTCRHFLTNPSYFICRRAGVVGWHLERHRACPGPPTRCCRTRSGRESRLTSCRIQHHRNISPRRRANGERRPDRLAGAAASSAGRGRRAVTTKHNAPLKSIGLPPMGHCCTVPLCTSQAAITVTPTTQHNTPARNATAAAAR